MGYENYGTCNLCAGPVRRPKRKWNELQDPTVHCARCGACAHEPGEYGPVVLMRRPAAET